MAVKRSSTHTGWFREKMAGENLPKMWWKGALELWF
jgi:hypothetical protein